MNFRQSNLSTDLILKTPRLQCSGWGVLSITDAEAGSDCFDTVGKVTHQPASGRGWKGILDAFCFRT